MKSGNWFGNLFMYFVCVFLINIMTPFADFIAIFGFWQVGHDWMMAAIDLAAFRDIDYFSFH